MARQANYPDIVTEVLAPKLGTDSKRASEFEDFFFKLYIPKSMAGFGIARGRQGVKVFGAG